MSNLFQSVIHPACILFKSYQTLGGLLNHMSFAPICTYFTEIEIMKRGKQLNFVNGTSLDEKRVRKKIKR